MSLRFPYPGATTIGLRGSEAVVLASEKRLSYGHFVVSKNVKKVFKITDYSGAACAGMVADMQILIRDATAIVNLYKMNMKAEPYIRTIAKILSNHLFSRRLYPYLTQTLVGGFDSEGPHVFVLDPLGSLIEDDYAAVGSGAEIAIGVLEADYKPGMEKEDVRQLAVKAVKSSISRDSASGNGIDVLLFTKDGLDVDETILL